MPSSCLHGVGMAGGLLCVMVTRFSKQRGGTMNVSAFEVIKAIFGTVFASTMLIVGLFAFGWVFLAHDDYQLALLADHVLSFFGW